MRRFGIEVRLHRRRRRLAAAANRARRYLPTVNRLHGFSSPRDSLFVVKIGAKLRSILSDRLPTPSSATVGTPNLAGRERTLAPAIVRR